jgi:hypothetical protein
MEVSTLIRTRTIQKHTPNKDFKYYEILPPKVFFAIQDLNNSNDLLLMLDYGIFYEFIPMDTLAQPNKSASLSGCRIVKIMLLSSQPTLDCGDISLVTQFDLHH